MTTAKAHSAWLVVVGEQHLARLHRSAWCEEQQRDTKREYNVNKHNCSQFFYSYNHV